MSIDKMGKLNQDEGAVFVLTHSDQIIYANSSAQHLFHLENSQPNGFIFPKDLVAINTKRFRSARQKCREDRIIAVEFIANIQTMESLKGKLHLISTADENFYQAVFAQPTQMTGEQHQDIINQCQKLTDQKKSLSEILEEVLAFLFARSCAKGGLVYVADYQKNNLRLTQVSGISNRVLANLDHIQFDEEIIQTVFQKQQVLFVEDLTTDPRLPAIVPGVMLQEFGVKSFLGIPLVAKEQSIGMIGLVFTQVVPPPDISEKNILQTIGNCLGRRIKIDQVEAREQKFFQQLSILRDLPSLWRNSHTYDELVRATAQVVVDRLQFCDLSFFQYLPETGMLKLVAIAGGMTPYLPVGYQQSVTEGMIGWVVRNRKSRYVPDYRQDELLIRIPEVDTMSELAVPVQIADAIFGVINMESQRLEAFDDIDIWTMETLAQNLAFYLENMHQSEKQNQRVENLEMITRVTQFLNTTVTIQQLQQNFVHFLREILNVYYISFYKYDQEKHQLTKISSAGGSERQWAIGTRTSADKGVLGWVVKNHKPLYVPDVNNHPVYLRISDKDYGSEYCSPILFADKLYGVLNIESCDVNAFYENQIMVLETIIDHFAKALHNSILFEEIIQEKVKTDAILSQMNEGIVIVDHGDQVIYANRSAQMFFPQLDLKKSNQTILLPFFQHAKANLTPDKSQINFDFVDEHRTWQVTTIRMLPNIGDENILIIFEDFSQERQKAQKILENERMQIAVKMAGSIAHELNQPLTGILGYCSLLLEDMAPDSNTAKDIQVIEDQANRIATLIKKFQNVVKIKTKPYLGEIEIVDWEESGVAEE